MQIISENQPIEIKQNQPVDNVITTLEANNINHSDEEQLLWSTSQNRVIYTFNMGDF